MKRFSGATLVLLGIWLCAGLATVGRGETPSGGEATENAPPAAREGMGRGWVVVLEIDATINPATAEYIHDGIDRAVAVGASAVIIQLDTPGGLLDSTKSIVKDLLSSPVPTVVYVSPAGGGAISAGVFITMAAHIAAMAPGTNIGAAHPVTGQGGDIEGDIGEKVENFAASLSRTIAQKRGRNVEWAELAVRESVSITESEALELNVVDLVARDLDELLTALDGREIETEHGVVVLNTAASQIERHEMRLRQKILNVLAHPTVAYLLLAAGMLGLYTEFTNPGLFFPGIAGAICLLLGATALQILPINYTGLALMVLGLGLLVTEAFVPSFGILGIGGLVGFVIGSLLVFETPESTLRIDRGIIGGAATAFGSCFLLLAWLVVRSQRLRPLGGADGMVGEIGELRRSLGAGRGKVFVHGEHWDATVEGEVYEGDAVEVVSVEGLRVHVRKVASDA
jgi:membrane-bound serine protease (ClpP class)